MHRRNLSFGASLLLALAAGVGVGRGTAPASSPTIDSSPVPASQASVPVDGAALARDTGRGDVLSTADEAARAAEAVRDRADVLRDWESDPRADVVRALAEWGGDPSEVVGVMIDAMSDDELRSTLMSLTRLSESDLDEVRDLRAFSRRVSEIAIDGVLSESPPEDAGVTDVRFAQDFDPQSQEDMARDRFAVDGRMYAIFPTDQYPQDEVFVKWYRADDPEIMLFDQYPVEREAEESFVWMDRPEGWPEGEYRVEVYSGDEDLRKLSTGRYYIDPSVAAVDSPFDDFGGDFTNAAPL